MVVVVMDVKMGDILLINLFFIFDLNFFVCGILVVDYLKFIENDYRLFVMKFV